MTRLPVKKKLVDTRKLKDNVRWAIEHAPLSQAEIADALGVSESLVSKWKKGHQTPSSNYLTQLPWLCDVNGHWLLTGDGPKRPVPVPDAVERLELIQRLSDPYPDGDALHAAMDLIERMIAEGKGGGSPGGG